MLCQISGYQIGGYRGSCTNIRTCTVLTGCSYLESFLCPSICKYLFWKLCRISFIKLWIQSFVFYLCNCSGFFFLLQMWIPTIWSLLLPHCSANLDCNVIGSTWVVSERSVNYFLMSLIKCLMNMQIPDRKIKLYFWIPWVRQKNKLLKKKV